MTHIRRAALLAALGALALASLGPVQAEESQFGYAYTTDLLPKGAKELEQWATWRHQKISGYFDQIDARTEFEYGLADNLQTAIYANYAWSRAYHNGPFGATTPPEPFSYDIPGPDEHYSATRFVGVSGEIIYRALSPYTDALGVAFYEEPTVGPGFYELETKLILQKNFLDDRLISLSTTPTRPNCATSATRPAAPRPGRRRPIPTRTSPGHFAFAPTGPPV